MARDQEREFGDRGHHVFIELRQRRGQLPRDEVQAVTAGLNIGGGTLLTVGIAFGRAVLKAFGVSLLLYAFQFAGSDHTRTVGAVTHQYLFDVGQLVGRDHPCP